MKAILIAILFLPFPGFSQQDTVSSDDDVRIMGKFDLFELSNQKSIDSVFGKPDSIWIPVVDVAPEYQEPLYVNPVISYPNAEFSIMDSQHYLFDDIIFTKRKEDFFVRFGTQILSATTSIDDVRKHFYIWPYYDSAYHIQSISGISMKVRSLEIYNPYPNETDGPTWIFDFFDDKLVRITFVPHGA